MSDPTTREALWIAMAGTEDGDTISPESEIPIGEAFRLAWEHIEAAGYRPAHEVGEEIERIIDGTMTVSGLVEPTLEDFAADARGRLIRDRVHAAFPAPTEPLWETKPDGRIGPSAAGERAWNAAAPTEGERK